MYQQRYFEGYDLNKRIEEMKEELRLSLNKQ